MRAAFRTFGCKLNQYESESIAESFRGRGFDVVEEMDGAEICVINTCTVTGRADHKARAFARSVSRRLPESLIIVTGCSAELEPDAYRGIGANVVVVPQSRKSVLLDLAGVMASSGDWRKAAVDFGAQAYARSRARDVFRFEALRPSFHSRAFLKIQDGCDTRCAYCRIPLARGGGVSLDADTAVRRAADLAGRGYREIILTGVNICSYRSRSLGLAGLLSMLTDAVGPARLRLSSLEPDAVDDGLLGALSNPKICPHFHLALQSGSDAVLRGMRRRYGAAQAAVAAAALKGIKDDPYLAADFIVGFPGEMPGDHEATLRLVRNIGFSALHVFPFSPRRGTPAAEFDGQVQERVRTRRAGELGAVSRELTAAYGIRWVGREVEAIIEKGAGGEMAGTAENYLHLIIHGAPDGEHVGKVARCRIASFQPRGNRGESVCDFIGFVT